MSRSTAEIVADLRNQLLSVIYFDTVREAADRLTELDAQIAKLATYIMDEVPGEPSASEGAVDCAIRLLRRFPAPLGERVPGIPPWQAGRRLEVTP